jgi:ABC-type glycerol-3-phosphate transport system substrate-binding protein
MMPTRREVVRQVGTMAVLGTTAPCWLVRRAHAARREKLIVWMPVTQPPQVETRLKEPCYAYATQAGIPEHELEYARIDARQWPSKLGAALEAGNPPDVTPPAEKAPCRGARAARCRGPQHVLDVTDLVETLQQTAGGFFPTSLQAVMSHGKAYGGPQAVSPWTLVTRLDLLEAAKVDPLKTWDAFIEVGQQGQHPPQLTGYGMCLGLTTDTEYNIMPMIWSEGGTLVGADEKTIPLDSPGTVQAGKRVAEMYQIHKIIPEAALSWDKQGNNKACQARQVLFVLHPSGLYATLAGPDRDLQQVTGRLPGPAGPAGASEALSTNEGLLFTHNPYPEVAKGLVQYSREPEPLGVGMEAAGGRWGPPDPGLYPSAFWQQPALAHWRAMVSRARPFAAPGRMTAAAAEVLSTHLLARMMPRVLVDHGEAEKAVEEAHHQVVASYTRDPEG